MNTNDPTPTDAAIPTPKIADHTYQLCSDQGILSMQRYNGGAWVPTKIALEVERELHLAKSPVEASEAAKAAAYEVCGAYKMGASHESIAESITRHFQHVLEENARLKAEVEQCRQIIQTYSDAEGDLTAQLATLNKELEEYRRYAKERFTLWETANGALNQLRSDLAQCQREKAELYATENELTAARDEAREQFKAAAADNFTLRAQLAQAEGKVEALQKERDGLKETIANAYIEAARLDSELNRIQVTSDSLACVLNLNKNNDE